MPDTPSPLWLGIRQRLADPSVAFYDASATAGDDPIRRSGRDLLAACHWLAPRLRSLTPRPFVWLLFIDTLAYLPVFWSCLRSGQPCWPLAIPADASEQQREAERLVRAYVQGDGQAGALPLLIHDSHGAGYARRIAAAARGAVELLPLEHLFSAPPQAPRRHPNPSDRPAYLLETSGTSGSPRAACFAANDEPAPLSTARVLWLFPLSSSSGIAGSFALHQATTYLPLADAIRNPDRLLQLIESQCIEALAMPPVLLAALLRHLREPSGPLQRRDLSSLRRVNLGSAPSRTADLAALETALESWGLKPGVLHTGYGLTETGVVAWGSLAAHRDLSLAPGETAIGPLFGECAVRFDGEGALEVRTPSKFMGYWHQGQLQPFRSGEDWFATGDRARMEGDLLVLCGRSKDILVVNSRKVSLPALEESLQQRFAALLELVVACALPPAPGQANERLLLVVAPGTALAQQNWLGDALPAQLREHVQGEFGLAVHAIEQLPLEAFPRTSTGKVRKLALVELFGADPEPKTDRPDGLSQALLTGLASLAGRPAPLSPSEKLSQLGVDSLALVGLIGELERRHSCQCQLHLCPPDPSLADLLALFAPQAAAVDPRAPKQVLVRAHHTQLLRSANLSSSGMPVGLDGVTRLHNPAGSGPALVLLTAWDNPMISAIAQRRPDLPLYALRMSQDFKTPANHEYLVFCYLEWLESLLLALNRPFVLAGSCRAAAITLRLAELVQQRQLEPSHTILLQWSPGFGTGLRPFSGPTSYHLHLEHHQGDQQRQQQLWSALQALTPNLKQVLFSSWPYPPEGEELGGDHPADVLLDLLPACP